MPTRIHLERRTAGGWTPASVTTAEFARIRRDTVNYRPRAGSWDSAFVDFYDVGRRGPRAFLEDTRVALRPIIEGKARGAPSFRTFKRALIEGRLFAIITARSHSSAAIRRGVEYFIRKALTPAERERMLRNLRKYIRYFGDDPGKYRDTQVLKNYLDLNHYRGVSSPEFQKLMGRKLGGSESPERAKMLAVREFVKHVVKQMKNRRGDEPVSVGFSDDDPHNVEAVEDFLRKELARAFPDFKFVVYDTSDRRRAGGRKIVIRKSRQQPVGLSPSRNKNRSNDSLL
jgi:hypothetical protein